MRPYNDNNAPCSLKCVLLFQFICHQFGILLLILLLCACGIIMGTVAAEISCFTPITFVLYKVIATQFPHKKSADYDGWNNVFRYVSDNKNKHDRLLKIISVQKNINHLSFCRPKPERLGNYLINQEVQDIPFMNTKFKCLIL